MREMIKKAVVLGLIAPFVVACSAEEEPVMEMEKEALNVSHSNLMISDVESSADLIGTWRIVSMTSDVAADLNDADVEKTTNLLEETTCFDSMFFRFDADGTVRTGQAKLDFGADGQGFDCDYGEYEAQYTAEGNELEVFFTFNGTKISQKKTVGLSSDETGEYLHVFLTAAEAANYVTDPGNTAASEIGKVDMVFKKQ